MTSDETLLPEELLRESSSERKRVEQKQQLIQLLWLSKAKITTSMQTIADLKDRIAQLEANDLKHRTEKLEMTARISALESTCSKKKSPPKAHSSSKVQPRMGVRVNPGDNIDQSMLGNVDLSIVTDDRAVVDAKKEKQPSPPSLLHFHMDPRPSNFHFYGRYQPRRGHKNPIRGNFVSRYDDQLNPLYGRGYAISGRGGRRGYSGSPSQRRPFPRGHTGSPILEDFELPTAAIEPTPVTISQTRAKSSTSTMVATTSAIPLPPVPDQVSAIPLPPQPSETPKASRTRKRFSRFTKENPQRSDTTDPRSSSPPSYDTMQQEPDIDVRTSDEDRDFIDKRDGDN